MAACGAFRQACGSLGRGESMHQLPACSLRAQGIPSTLGEASRVVTVRSVVKEAELQHTDSLYSSGPDYFLFSPSEQQHRFVFLALSGSRIDKAYFRD